MVSHFRFWVELPHLMWLDMFKWKEMLEYKRDMEISQEQEMETATGKQL